MQCQAILNGIYAVLRSSGMPLDDNFRQELEPLFEKSLTHVRVHCDKAAAKSAEAIASRAYTVRNHIIFATGEYNPGTRSGMRLLAHEVAHVLQQQDATLPAVLRVAASESIFEREADSAADHVMRGVSVPPIRCRLDVARIQRESCPGPPEWVRISSKPPAIHEPANAAIEMAYLKAHSSRDSAILVGSQFEKGGWRDIKLPKGAPNKAFNDALLSELRGIEKQRQPDIVDFHSRAFYEIKSDEWVAMNPGKGEEQLRSLYRTTEAIQTKYGGLPWKEDNVDWRPPVVLPFPGNASMIVCTAATNYDKTMRGLIQYHVRLNAKRRKREQKRVPKEIRVRSFEEAFEHLVGDKRNVRKVVGESFDPYFPEFVIIAPSAFFDTWKRQYYQQKHDRLVDAMRVPLPPFLNTRHPIGQFRSIGWALVGATAAVYAGFYIVVTAGALTGSAATAGVGAATGGGAVGGAEVVSLAAYKAMRASKVAKALAAAAGVLAVVGTPRSASAKEPMISDVGAVRIVPVEYFKPYMGFQAATENNDMAIDFMHTPETMAGRFDAGAMVIFNWAFHRVIGHFAVEY